MSLFRKQGEGVAAALSPLVGVDALRNVNGTPDITVTSIPFHTRGMDARAPQQNKGLLALFGIRDALDELQHWRTVARNSQAQFAYLQVQVDVGVAASGVLTREQLRSHGVHMRFVNVRRCAAEMQKEWLQQFAAWVREEGGDAAQTMHHVRQMALRPDLFERLLHTDPDLQHVEVMVLPLADRSDVMRIRQVAYLRAGASITSVMQGSDQIHMQLPQWMTDGMQAKV